MGFAGVHEDGLCLFLLLAPVVILLVVCYRTDTCLAASIIYVDPVSRKDLNQHFAGS